MPIKGEPEQCFNNPDLLPCKDLHECDTCKITYECAGKAPWHKTGYCACHQLIVNNKLEIYCSYECSEF